MDVDVVANRALWPQGFKVPLSWVARARKLPKSGGGGRYVGQPGRFREKKKMDRSYIKAGYGSPATRITMQL